jgi:anti-sigma regulatory factor (Ser/Thr protein kinase)
MAKTQSAHPSAVRGTTVRELPREEGCAAAAREFIAQELGATSSGDALSNALLVVSELATNAYRHGRGRIEVRLQRGERSLRIEVVDGGAPGHVHRRESPGVTGGWGLRLVDELALAWGSTGPTTRVWAELPL